MGFGLSRAWFEGFVILVVVGLFCFLMMISGFFFFFLGVIWWV
jgi:hypothetical protein